MAPGSEDVALSPGGESAVSSKRGASQDPGSAAAVEDAARKKKKMGAGSRGVANLTPEQLAKKRENGTFSPVICSSCAQFFVVVARLPSWPPSSTVALADLG